MVKEQYSNWRYILNLGSSLCSEASVFLAWSRASVFNDALCLSDYCLVPVVGDVMGFCSWLFVEGFEEKRGEGRRG